MDLLFTPRNGAPEIWPHPAGDVAAAGRVLPVLDLRSDVVTPPTEEMWDAMRAEGFRGTPLDDDRSVRHLEEMTAELMGKEAAIFVPTCTVANILALMTLGERGTQVVLEKTSHIATSEEWGLAYVCGLMPCLQESATGALDAVQLQTAILQPHSAQKNRTSLVCLENTHTNSGGQVMSAEKTLELGAVAARYGAAVHLDGARIFNAAVALGEEPAALARGVDTVSVSLNKGLGAPLGAVLCGASKTITAARKNARRIGAATLHKASSLAAAGIVALKGQGHLVEDHRRARQLAGLLAGIPGLSIDLSTVQTNLIKCRLMTPFTASDFVGKLEKLEVLALARGRDGVRFVTHRAIEDDDLARVAEAVRAVLVD